MVRPMAAEDDTVDTIPDAEPPTGTVRRRVRRGTGQRARRQRELARERHRERVRRAVLVLLGVGVAVAILVALGPQLLDLVDDLRSGEAADTEDVAGGVGDGGDVAVGDGTDQGVPVRRTVLVATLDESGRDRVIGVQLLTDDPEGGAAIVFVPPSTVTDVPGYGLLPVADAGELGGVALLELTLENALGITVDASVTMTESSWAALFGRTGGFEVTVREPVEVRAGDDELERRFEPGPQFLDGPRLAELLTVDVPGQSELAEFPRAQLVLEGFLDAVADDLDDVFADGAPMLATAQPDVVEATLRGLVEARANDRLDVRTLPVEPVGSGTELVYRVDAQRGDAFATDVLGAGERVADGADGPPDVRLEVLNGIGRVGVGAEVAERLVPLGHTIVITGNAESFDQDTTLVTVRDDDDELLAAAREIVDVLGVGRVAVSSIPSTTVDITIVVGADYPSG